MSKFSLRGFLSTAVIGGALAASLAFTGNAAAQSYPSKAINYILAFNAGGAQA